MIHAGLFVRPAPFLVSTVPSFGREVGVSGFATVRRNDSLGAAYLLTSQTVNSCPSECCLWSAITYETGIALSSRGPAVVSARFCETPLDRAHIP